MPAVPNLSRPAGPCRKGFALVIVLSLMVLLTILAVGLLTLSAVCLRVGGQGRAMAEARSNARLALVIALGELQKAAGPDQRITALASSISGDKAEEPNMLGAWDSWHWTPGTSGPGYAGKSSRFRRWLVSTADPKTARQPKPELGDTMWLVRPPARAEGAAGGDAIQPTNPKLRAGRVPVQGADGKGAFAWAIMDESLKAPIQLPETEPARNGDRIARRTAPGHARPGAILKELAADKLGDPARIVSLATAALATGSKDLKKIPGYQADITPYSVGLLTNVAEGGMKTDLTTLFESSSANPSANGQQTLYFAAGDGAARWDYLRYHYQLYRRVAGSTGGKPQITLNQTDTRPSSNGVLSTTNTERLLPVIAKLQIMFSAVTHYSHIADRVQFYNEKGRPAGNPNYACPHLVYDPVVTLYNPYDVALDLTKLRIRIWDPPVRFAFKKNGNWLRDEFASGDFHPLGRFMLATEHNADAHRYFTLLLTQSNNSKPGARIRLEPGEVKVFSPWVENNWTWAMETAGGYAVRCFFDFNAANDFGNKDGRTQNLFGVETVPGWDPRAGLQTDHLSYSDARPQATRYDFEIANNWKPGWVAIKLNDSFSVEAKPGRATNSAGLPDFRVDLLAGATEATTSDILRTYSFRFADPAKELSANPANPVVSRTFLAGDILQKPDDKTVGGKSPFAILTMTAKTTKGLRDLSMPWLHNHPVTEGADEDTKRVGGALDTYDLRFEEVADFNQNPGGIEFDPGSNRGYFGATSFSNGGVTNVPMFRVPVTPAASLGDLIPANLVPTANLPRVTHAFGNSHAHPLIPGSAVTRPAITASARMLDHSYLLNDALWDSTYFSTAASFSTPLLSGARRGSLLSAFFAGTGKLLNPRFIPMLPEGGTPEGHAARLDHLDDTKLSKQLGAYLGVAGAFNVNSDSVPAWTAVLSSLRDADLRGWTMNNVSPTGKTAFPRTSLPIAGDSESATAGGIDLAGQVRWAGFRALSDKQVSGLAAEIVSQIRERGRADQAPSLTLAEFVNRRVGPSGELQTLAGLLQTAIDKTQINTAFHALDSVDLADRQVTNPSALNGIANPQAREGMSAQGAPSILTQGDLMSALAAVATVRGDTFRIRACGEARGSNGKVLATATCEAVVQRLPEYLDDKDEPQTKTADLKAAENTRFGRRFAVISFRWLNPEEI